MHNDSSLPLSFYSIKPNSKYSISAVSVSATESTNPKTNTRPSMQNHSVIFTLATKKVVQAAAMKAADTYSWTTSAKQYDCVFSSLIACILCCFSS